MFDRNRVRAGSLLLNMLALGAPALAAEEGEETLVLGAEEGGSSLGSITVEGENRISIEFDRPTLDPDLDAREVSGLVWSDPLLTIEEADPDPVAPILRHALAAPSAHPARPWLAMLATPPVAKFRPDLDGVSRWQLRVMDARGTDLTALAGEGNPPESIPWDGLGPGEKPVLPGITLTHVIDATDRAGNQRTFQGGTFTLPAYQTASGDTALALVPVAALQAAGTGGAPSPWLQEIADRIHEHAALDAPVEVRVHGRTYKPAMQAAEDLVARLQGILLGPSVRIRAVAVVDESAPVEPVAVVAYPVTAHRTL
jgi:hypothetical protein